MLLCCMDHMCSYGPSQIHIPLSSPQTYTQIFNPLIYATISTMVRNLWDYVNPYFLHDAIYPNMSLGSSCSTHRVSSEATTPNIAQEKEVESVVRENHCNVSKNED